MGYRSPYGTLPPLDLRQLQYFVAVADNGSVTAAAAEVGLAQPTLSENISRLERRLGVDLIVRGTRGIQLTECGVALVIFSRDLMRQSAVALENIQQLGGQTRGLVSIGLPFSLGQVLSVPLAETVKVELPEVRLRVAEGMSADILNWLETDRIHFGVVYDVPDGGEFVARPVLDEELFLVTAPDNWSGEIRNGIAVEPLEIADLENLPLVLPSPGHGFRNIVERIAHAAGIPLDVWLEMDSLPQMVEMVSRASAYSILPHTATFRHMASGEVALVPFAARAARRMAHIVHKRCRPLGKASGVVADAMVAIIAESVLRFGLRANVPV